MQGGSVHHNTKAMVDLQPSLEEREREILTATLLKSMMELIVTNV